MTSGSKPCVYCGEQIRSEAKKCRYCGEWFDDSGPTSTQASPNSSNHPRLPLGNLERPSDSSAPPPTSVAPPLPTTGAAPPRKPPVNRLAVWSLVVNLLGVPIGSILAIVLGNRSIRQIKASEGKETGRSLALAGVIWGWAAIGITVVILLIILAVNTTRVSREDVSQQAANLAFAEHYYYEEHGEFTSDLDKLNPVTISRIHFGVYTDVSGQHFCVDAIGGDDERPYRAATWDDQFTPDGERVQTWRTSCNNQWIRPAAIPAGSA